MKVIIDKPFNVLVAGNYLVNPEDMLAIQCLANVAILDFALGQHDYSINNVDVLYSDLVNDCLGRGWTWDDIQDAIAWYFWDSLTITANDMEAIVQELQRYAK